MNSIIRKRTFRNKYRDKYSGQYVTDVLVTKLRIDHNKELGVAHCYELAKWNIHE